MIDFVDRRNCGSTWPSPKRREVWGQTVCGYLIIKTRTSQQEAMWDSGINKENSLWCSVNLNIVSCSKTSWPLFHRYLCSGGHRFSAKVDVSSETNSRPKHSHNPQSYSAWVLHSKCWTSKIPHISSLYAVTTVCPLLGHDKQDTLPQVLWRRCSCRKDNLKITTLAIQQLIYTTVQNTFSYSRVVGKKMLPQSVAIDNSSSGTRMRNSTYPFIGLKSNGITSIWNREVKGDIFSIGLFQFQAFHHWKGQEIQILTRWTHRQSIRSKTF